MTGFRIRSLAKDLSLLVVDAASGIGNGLVIPAGPLRAPLDAQIARASALIVIGDGERADRLIDAFEAQAKPVLKARVVPRQDRRWLSVLPVIGFAGIARPSKFFATLRNNGARLIDARAYPDHCRYSERQARRDDSQSTSEEGRCACHRVGQPMHRSPAARRRSTSAKPGG